MIFSVSAITDPFGELVATPKDYNDPEQAILNWCKLSKKYPTCVSIQPQTKEDAKALLIWANENFDKVRAYMNKYKCPYRTDWMQKEIHYQVINDNISMRWEYDQLYPFCMG